METWEPRLWDVSNASLRKRGQVCRIPSTNPFQCNTWKKSVNVFLWLSWYNTMKITLELWFLLLSSLLTSKLNVFTNVMSKAGLYQFHTSIIQGARCVVVVLFFVVLCGFFGCHFLFCLFVLLFACLFVFLTEIEDFLKKRSEGGGKGWENIFLYLKNSWKILSFIAPTPRTLRSLSPLQYSIVVLSEPLTV